MKFLKEESNAYQYKGYTVIQTSSGYRIKDGNNNWVGGEFDTDVDAHEHIDGLKESFESSYKYVASKSVQDSDGFYTDYTWYKSDDGLNVFVFGDSDIYTPDAGDFDFETESDDEAQEWFDSYNGFEEDILDEATAVAERPLSNLQGTLSSVLLAHKDEVDTLFDKKAAVEFLDRIMPEVKNKGYVEKVKQEIMRGKRSPVEYFYNIILKGDGDGTEKGGKVTKQAKIHKWAKEGLEDDDELPLDKRYYVYSSSDDCVNDSFLSKEDAVEFAIDNGYPVVKVHNYYIENDKHYPDGDPEVVWTHAINNQHLTEGMWRKGDSVTLWWTDPKWSPTSPCYASCEYVGKARDGKYRFKSTTYGWEFLLDTVEMTITTPQGKTFAVDNSSGWLRNSLEESYNIQFYQIFKNPEKPTDNGRMIAQAGTEDEAKAKGDKLVGKGNYLIKAVCDDGKVRDVDLYSYFNESRNVIEESSDLDLVYVASSIDSLNDYYSGLGDACKKLRDGNMCSYRGYEVEFVDGEYNVYLLESIDESKENKPLYVIKDSHGNQLSAPNPDDEELWDRVASMEARGRRGLCVVAYTGKKESLKEWNEFSDDDVEDDLTHAAVYGGDSKYCRECGAVKKYDEDGFAYCPECCGELDEAYYINDEILRTKQDRLMLELEDQGYQEIDSRSQDGCYWTFFRKMVDGKGQWKAVFIDSSSGEGKIVDITYGQARGYEPLSNMDSLRKDLGNKLLPQ